MSEVDPISQEQIDLHLAVALKSIDAASEGEIREAAQVILSPYPKDLRQVRSGALGVLRLIRSLACLGYHYTLHRGRSHHGSPSDLPNTGTALVSQETEVRSLDSGLASEGTATKKLSIVEHATLFNDESTRQKLKVMSKWDAMFDDARNKPTVDMDEQANQFLELGKTYKITISFEEVK